MAPDGQHTPHGRLKTIASAISFTDTMGGHIVVLALLQRLQFIGLGDAEQVEQATRQGYHIYLRKLAREVLKKSVGIGDIDRHDLHALAKYLVDAIDRQNAPDHYYPKGWHQAYRLIRDGIPMAPVVGKQTAARAVTTDWRNAVLDAINYVASTLGCSEDAVLKRIHRTRKTLRKGDDKLAVALLSESARIPGHEDAAG